MRNKRFHFGNGIFYLKCYGHCVTAMKLHKSVNISVTSVGLKKCSLVDAELKKIFQVFEMKRVKLKSVGTKRVKSRNLCAKFEAQKLQLVTKLAQFGLQNIFWSCCQLGFLYTNGTITCFVFFKFHCMRWFLPLSWYGSITCRYNVLFIKACSD